MGNKWFDEEVLEDTFGFANLEVIKMTTVILRLRHTKRFKKTPYEHEYLHIESIYY